MPAVRVDSIEKWNATFVPYGFHPAAMCPSYGLAEHTVGLLSWGIKTVPAASGEGLLHSSGNWGCQGEEEGDAVFVDPDTLELRETGQVRRSRGFDQGLRFRTQRATFACHRVGLMVFYQFQVFVFSFCGR